MARVLAISLALTLAFASFATPAAAAGGDAEISVDLTQTGPCDEEGRECVQPFCELVFDLLGVNGPCEDLFPLPP
jgi:hypothetical protein